MTHAPTMGVPAEAPPEGATCQNCGAPLLGPHCYRCGQPVNGLVRHFSSIVGDFFDSVFDLDARIFRTLGPLFARPGLLSREYFAGRRVRYVSPVRLFFFLSIVAFFVAQLTLGLNNDAIQFDGDGDPGIAQATTVAEVEAARDAALRDLREARDGIPANVPGARAGMDAGIAAVERDARERIAELQSKGGDAQPAASAEGNADAKAAATTPADDNARPDIRFNGERWDPVTNPIAVGWLPDFANRWINAQVGRGEDNIARIKDDPNLFKDAVLSALPSTLFVLLPIFALMLKLAYLFKRRLYMEHLIVALHSHAFLCLALLVILVLMAIGRALPAAAGATGLGQTVVAAWMPLYLLLMQKRVYGQGWTVTLLKYSVLGILYLVLLSLGVALTMLLSLVWM